MAGKYAGRVHFLLVYVREAHPTGGLIAPRNEREGVRWSSASSYEQKAGHASACARSLGIEFPTVVDGMDNAVEALYTAWPDRFYLVAADGRIAAKGKPGPAGFKAAALESAIEALLGR